MKTVSFTPKPHFPLLDGLRGIAALIVVVFHLMEGHATSHLDQWVNHGYLAVDFFFLLSGFVIGYAYDDRWSQMDFSEFARRRVFRLQPLVVFGSALGFACYYFQISPIWPAISETPVLTAIGISILGMFLLPVPPSMDIRGWNEMFPLNGPAWSLFFEYLVNLLYGLIFRKCSRTFLGLLVVLFGFSTFHHVLHPPSYDLVGGWSLEPAQLKTGFIRVLYPFFAGLLLFRLGYLRPFKHAFWWSAFLLVCILAMPRIGGTDQPWLNGWYEGTSVVFLFPFIVFLAAGSQQVSPRLEHFCKKLGALSYPLYITHFPLVYIYTAWIHRHQKSLTESLPMACLVLITSVLLAYLANRYFDHPIRRWLQQSKPIES